MSFNNKARDVITPADLDDFRNLMPLKISESETGARDKNAEDDEWVGKTREQGLLYAELKML
jgi:hypothetical protein